jgi:general secretion pathway protein G
MVQSSVVRIALAILCVLGLIPMVFLIWIGGWKILITFAIVIGVVYLFIKNFNPTDVNNNDWTGLRNLKDYLWSLKPLARKTIYFLILFYVLWLIGALVGYQYYKKENTKNECEAIVSSLIDHYTNTGKYPDHLKEIISSNPLRRDWTTDQWKNPYHYALKNAGKDFELVSAGKDGKFNTDDDLKFSSKK